MYSLNDSNQANLLAKNTVSFLDRELNYIASLPQHQQRAALHQIQVGMYVLNGLNELTAKGGCRNWQ